MGKKIISMLLVATLMLQLVACSKKDEAVAVETPQPVASAEVANEEAPKEGADNTVDTQVVELDYSVFDSNIFKDFFNQYFSLTEDEMLKFNQNPEHITEYYQELNDICSKRLNEIFNGYLSVKAKANLEKGYYRDYFDLPKKLEINEYVTYDAAKVEDVAIIGTRNSGTNRVYEVAVTTTNKVKPVGVANKEYVWDTEKLYYMSPEKATKPLPAFLAHNLVEKELSDSYVYQEPDEAGTMDEIKLVHHYWVEVAPGDKLQIESIKEAVPFTTDARQKATNTNYVTRVPYTKEPTPADKNKVIETLYTVIAQPKEFYKVYAKSLQSGYNTFTAMMKTQLGIEDSITLSENTYNNAFSEKLDPYKDNMVSLQIDKEHMTVEPSVYETKAQPRFKVIVPIKATDANGNVTSYQYEYLVGIEKEKIEYIHFVGTKLTPES